MRNSLHNALTALEDYLKKKKNHTYIHMHRDPAVLPGPYFLISHINHSPPSLHQQAGLRTGDNKAVWALTGK